MMKIQVIKTVGQEDRSGRHIDGYLFRLDYCPAVEDSAFPTETSKNNGPG